MSAFEELSDRPNGGLLGLSAALEALRNELEAAWLNSRGRSVRFRATEVTLTVETVLSTDKDGSARIRWWLIEAGGGVKHGEQTTQTLVLTLSPGLYDDRGELVGPLDVGDEQPGPEG